MARLALRMLAVAACAVAAWPVAASLAQSSDPVLDKYGWWNANQSLPADPSGGLLPPVTVPAPPGAPADGLYVESGADGTPLAIAAVSYLTGGGVEATLTLDLVDGASADAVTVAACPADGGWDAAQNGRWDRRPTYDPAACTFVGTASGDTVTFSIPVAAHEPGSAYLNLVIVPSEGSGAFAAAFDPPTSASLVTAPAAPASDSAGAPPGADEPAPVTFGAPGPSTAAPDAFEVPATPAPPTALASEGDDDVAAPTLPGVSVPPLGDDETSRGDRIVAGTTLALLTAGLWALTTRPQRPPRLLGSLATSASPAPAAVVAPGAAPRGLGRFSRNRTAPPTPI